MSIKFHPIKCPNCKQIIPGNEFTKHRREVHGYAKVLVKSSKSEEDKKAKKGKNPAIIEKPQKKDTKSTIYIYSERGRLITGEFNCFNCCVILRSAWRYHSNIGDIYLCSLCKQNIITSNKKVNMWSRMNFSAFESKRRKH